jgi:hypothetical protein
MTPSGPEVALRAVGTALAGVSIAFAAYMLSYGGGKTRVNGIEYLSIFAKPRGAFLGSTTPARAPAARSLDMAPTGSVAEAPDLAASPAPVEIVAARADRAWLRIDGAIRAVAPGEDVPRVGHVAAIVPRDDGWALLDDKGATLLSVGKHANGAALFARKLIFQ